MDHADVRAVLPRRTTLASDRGVLCVAHATHKLKAMFFVLVQVRCVAPVRATSPGNGITWICYLPCQHLIPAWCHVSISMSCSQTFWAGT